MDGDLNSQKKTMLYHLFDWLKQNGIKIPGGTLFQFITFRVLLAVLLSLVITMLYGKRLIQLSYETNRLVKVCGNWDWQVNNKKRERQQWEGLLLSLPF